MKHKKKVDIRKEQTTLKDWVYIFIAYIHHLQHNDRLSQ